MYAWTTSEHLADTDPGRLLPFAQTDSRGLSERENGKICLYLATDAKTRGTHQPTHDRAFGRRVGQDIAIKPHSPRSRIHRDDSHDRHRRHDVSSPHRPR